ncbi:hypothetical protein DFH28DRAFT_969970 [Melampsora americana]|nr:hypothetical protein DFH28DRAFT_969970 [Melampsora americana]
MSQSSSSSSDSDSSIEFDPISLTSTSNPISQTKNNNNDNNNNNLISSISNNDVQAPTISTTQSSLPQVSPDNQSDSSDPDLTNPSNQPVPTLANLMRDLPPVPPPNDTAKTPNVFGSSSEDDDDDDDDDDMDEVEAPILNISIDPQALPTSNQNPPTAATRSWMSQRKGKAILIDGNDQAMIDSDSNEERVKNGQIGSAQRIRDLGVVDEQIAALLRMASKALECLSPPAPSVKLEDSKSIQTFSESISEYFTTLNNVQLSLRTSISHLRAARISTRILFEPPHCNVPESSVGLGNLNAISYLANYHEAKTEDQVKAKIDVKKPLLSVGSLIAERDGWKDFLKALKTLSQQKDWKGKDS